MDIFRKNFFDKIDERWADINFEPLSIKKEVNYKKIEDIINKCLENNKDLFNFSERINLEQFNKKKMEKNFTELNFAFLGESGVGKTCLIENLKSQKFIMNIRCTTNIEIKTIYYRIKNEENEANELYKVYLYDTAGTERYHSIIPGAIKKADIIFLLYDLNDLKKGFSSNNKNSITYLISDNFFDLINNNCKKEVKFVLFGNKLDVYDNDVNEDSVKQNVNRLIALMKDNLKYNQEIFHFFISGKDFEKQEYVMNFLLEKFENNQEFKLKKNEIKQDLKSFKLNSEKSDSKKENKSFFGRLVSKIFCGRK